MHFVLGSGGLWQVTYRETNLFPLPRTSRFRNPDRIREMFDRFGTGRMSEDRQAFEYAISTGRGMTELEITPEQYERLKQLGDNRM